MLSIFVIFVGCFYYITVALKSKALLITFEPDPFEWRFYCRDGKTYNIDPYDYETEESYNKALKNAERRLIEEQKYSWCETCVYNDYGIDAENYESEAEYEAAIEERRNAWADYLSDEIREKAEKHLLKPEYFSDEEDFFQHLQEIEEAQNRPISRTKPFMLWKLHWKMNANATRTNMETIGNTKFAL